MNFNEWFAFERTSGYHFYFITDWSDKSGHYFGWEIGSDNRNRLISKGFYFNHPKDWTANKNYPFVLKTPKLSANRRRKMIKDIWSVK